MVPTELCHLLSYWHEVPFLSFLSVLFVDRVQQKVVTGSSALAFLARSWMIPEVTPGCHQEKRVSGVWASPHFLLSTAAPSKQGSTAAWHLASRQDGSSNKTCKYFVRDCGSSLWSTSGMLTTELYWHSVETVGKANWNHLEWGMVIVSVVTVKTQWLNVNSKNMKIKVEN